MTFTLLYMPSERLPAFSYGRILCDVFYPVTRLQTVAIQYDAEVIQPMRSGKHDGLPYRALLRLPIAEQDIGARCILLALCCQCRACGKTYTVSQRARRQRNAIHAGACESNQL